MSHLLNIMVGGLQFVSGFVLVANSMETGPSFGGLLAGTASLGPVAWAIAGRFVSDS